MRREEYAAVCLALRVSLCEPPDTEAALALGLPGVTQEALVSIHSQECALQMRQNFGFHRRPEQQRRYVRQWLEGADLLLLCREANLPPCHLVRFILTAHLGLSGPGASRLLREPAGLRAAPEGPAGGAPRLGPEARARLEADIRRACAADLVSSPATSTIQRVIGLEYEGVLQRKLRAAGIPFWSEDELRAQDALKTPDVQLQVPVSIRGHVVHWIDSKASFCSEAAYRLDLQQFRGYVNRVGPGMVVYWFGFVAELQDDSDILLADGFPDADIVRLADGADEGVGRGLENRGGDGGGGVGGE